MRPQPSPEEVVAPLAEQPGTVWLDGGAHGWSVVVWSPRDLTTDPADWPAAGRARTRSRGPHALPFTGGCVGYVGYEAGAAVAPVPAGRTTPEPAVWLGRYDGGLLWHGPTQRWTAVGQASVRREAEALLRDAHRLPPAPPPAPAQVRTRSRADYLAAVAVLQAHIAAGDVYQVNLTRPVHVDGSHDAWATYRRLRAASQPDRGAYLVLDDGIRVLCNSPERLLDVDGDRASTEPIKGTRPRGRDPDADAALAAALAGDAKELAELTMIVDLCRNDLGRVAVPGTVRTEGRTVRGHANVLHASQVVAARLAPGLDAWDALAALFPPGSVVGAPKVRAALRIRQAEPDPRGVYCGAVGFVSDEGTARWSVAIRTAVRTPSGTRFHVGGGIVADSDPAAEWAETVTKGSVLAAALGVVDQ